VGAGVIHAPPQGVPEVHVIVGVQVMVAGQVEVASLIMHGVGVTGGLVVIHAPPQGEPGVHVIVGVQDMSAGHVVTGSLTTHGVAVTSGGTEMQSPPQGSPVVHTIVGVQVEPVEQPAGSLIVQGGRGVGVVIQRPPQLDPSVHVMVGVQVMVLGQAVVSPMAQGIVHISPEVTVGVGVGSKRVASDSGRTKKRKVSDFMAKRPDPSRKGA